MFDVEKVQLVPKVEGFSIPNSFGIYRTDTKDHLGTVGSDYTPVQNKEMLDIVAESATLAGLDVQSVTFRSFKGGRKVSFQVKLPNWSVSGDEVERYMTAVNSHNGSTSVGVGLVGIRVVCTNTWLQALSQCKKFRHTSSVMDRVKALSDEINQSIEVDKELFEEFQTMFNNPYSDLDHSKFIKELIGYDLSDLEEKETRKRNTFEDISDAIDTELISAGRNEWGLFNGVTRYTNHVRAAGLDDPGNYIMFGSGATLVNKALGILSN